MDNFGIKAMLIAVLAVAVFLLWLYQTRIRASVRSTSNLIKFTIVLLFAATTAWVLFPETLHRYSIVCVAVVLLAQTGYIWANSGAKSA